MTKSKFQIKSKIQMTNKGFTLVELLIAISIFVTFIALASLALVEIIRVQYKGNVIRETQSNARYIMETIIREARGADGAISETGERVLPAYKIYSTSCPSYFTGCSLPTLEILNTAGDKVTSSLIYKKTNNALSLNRFSAAKPAAGFPQGFTKETGYPVDYNNPVKDVQITKIDFSGSSIPADLSVPPYLKILLVAESPKGASALRVEQRAKITIESSVTPRRYY